MDYSFVETGGKLPGDTLPVPFDFRTRDEVYVSVDGVDVSISFYSWVNDGLINVLSGFPHGTKTRVERRTSIGGYESSQSGSSVYDWRGANANFDQNLFIIQEYADKETSRNAIVDGLTDRIEQTQDLVEEAAGYMDLCEAWAMTPEDVDVAGQATGSRSSLHYSVKSYKFSLTAGDRAADSLAYANQSKGYRDTTQGYATTAQAYAVSMSLINGTDYSAKYWANQAYLAGGVPIGTIIDSYGNGATTPVGYLKVIPGLEITSAYPEFKAWAIANGWTVNGNGNPVFPSTDDALFKRQWRAGQSLRDAGRAFGTVQADKMQGHKHGAVGGNFFIQGASGTSYTGGGGTAGVDPRTDVPVTDGVNGTPRTGLETNPANITVTWFIKAYSGALDAATVAAAQVLADLADARARLTAAEAKITWEKIAVVDFTGQTSLVQNNLGAFLSLRVSLDVTSDTVASAVTMQASSDNGSNWLAGGTDYVTTGPYSQSGQTTAAASGVTGSAWAWFYNNSITVGRPAVGSMLFGRWNKAKETQGNGTASHIAGTQFLSAAYAMNYAPSTALNALKFTFSSAMSGRLIIEGIKG